MTVDNQGSQVAARAAAAKSLGPAASADFSELLADAVTFESLEPVEPPPPAVSKGSLDAAHELAASSARRVDIPVRKSFVRPMTPNAPAMAPMARIYRGGRGGTVALKLLLALIWKCSAEPFATAKPARAWATLLDLDDPAGNGARRIKDAMRTLQAEGLIELTARAGYPNTVTLRDESGLGLPYQLPSSAYNFAERTRSGPEELAANTYFKVSQKLWTQGHIQAMSGPALVMLLILLAEQAGTGAEVWFSTAEFPARYSISAKSRAAGTEELRKRGLLTVRSQSLAQTPGADTFAVQRRRKVYRLTAVAQTLPPEPPQISGTIPRRTKTTAKKKSRKSARMTAGRARR